MNGKELLKQQETCLNSTAKSLIQQWSLSSASLAGNCNSVISPEVDSTSGNFCFQLKWHLLTIQVTALSIWCLMFPQVFQGQREQRWSFLLLLLWVCSRWSLIIFLTNKYCSVIIQVPQGTAADDKSPVWIDKHKTTWRLETCAPVLVVQCLRCHMQGIIKRKSWKKRIRNC